MDSYSFPFLFFLAVFQYFLTLVRYQGGSLTQRMPMLITAFLQFRPEGHRELRREAGSLRWVECLVEFEPGTFGLLL